MLWFKKRPEAPEGGTTAEQIFPAELAVPFDAELFQQHFTRLVQLPEAAGGVEACIASLAAKHQLFAAKLDRGAVAALDLDMLEALLDHVFTARRRLYPALAAIGKAQVARSIDELLYGADPLAGRMEAFIEAIPAAGGEDREAMKAANKLRRAAWDFAAELLHFSDPVRYPLMTRWVWDQATVSGALREFIRGNDSMVEIPLGNSAEMFEGARVWLAERIAEEGLYRDVHFWVDLVLGQAYVTYFRSMAEGGLGGDFGRGTAPQEQLTRLLGIDIRPKNGRSRVKKEASSAKTGSIV